MTMVNVSKMGLPSRFIINLAEDVLVYEMRFPRLALVSFPENLNHPGDHAEARNSAGKH